MTRALTKTNLLILIFYFIGCQQFPILRIGGPKGSGGQVLDPQYLILD